MRRTFWSDSTIVSHFIWNKNILSQVSDVSDTSFKNNCDCGYVCGYVIKDIYPQLLWLHIFLILLTFDQKYAVLSHLQFFPCSPTKLLLGNLLQNYYCALLKHDYHPNSYDNRNFSGTICYLFAAQFVLSDSCIHDTAGTVIIRWFTLINITYTIEIMLSIS